ncbi:hypothetical protein Ciccas_001478 [Cichlidogyrus casuarinus]|uniref:Uncharacterized protein n=1 Tax=Cichlidogyrus casuarinus TaxID=1844966 RepID=A0ABD2QJX9_9PLAT
MLPPRHISLHYSRDGNKFHGPFPVAISDSLLYTLSNSELEDRYYDLESILRPSSHAQLWRIVGRRDDNSAVAIITLPLKDIYAKHLRLSLDFVEHNTFILLSEVFFNSSKINVFIFFLTTLSCDRD